MLRDFLTLIVVAASVGAADPARLDLTGKIASGGKPIPDATVFLYTAGVRTGTSSYCPSCYADCGKHAATAADGTFHIASLDSELIFRVLVVADGYEPIFVAKVDPATGPMITELKPRRAGNPYHTLRGRVVDENGHAVVGAEVFPDGIKIGGGHTWGNVTAHMDPMAITDRNGQFGLVCKDEVTQATLCVSARGLATAFFEDLEVWSGEPHVMPLTRGATLGGRLLRNGKPLVGAMVGLAQVDRIPGHFVGEFTIGTGKDGHFEFANVKPNDHYYVYGKMESSGVRGVTPVKSIYVGPDQSVSDAGDLEVIGGFGVGGKVRLSDGKPVPAGTRITLGRDQAWDSQIVLVGEGGSFVFHDVPAELVTMSLRIKGYQLSAKNYSFNTPNGFLEGMIAGDRNDLVLLMEPGEQDYEAYSKLSQAEHQAIWDRIARMINEPIRGAE